MSITLIFLGVLSLLAAGGWTITQLRAPVITDTYGNATVYIEAARGAVLLPNNCVSTQWQAEGIAGIYMDQAGAGGEDARPACIKSTTYHPSWRVDFPDGTSRLYQFDIPILFYDWVLWALIGGGIFAILAGIRLSAAVPAPRRKQVFAAGILLLTGVLTVVLALYLFTPNLLHIHNLTNGAEVYFEADRQWLARPDDCFIANWHFENINLAYAWNRADDPNSSGIVGIGENRMLCINMPRQLGIYTQDSILVFALPGLLYLEPAFWAMIVLGLLFVRQLNIVVGHADAIEEIHYVLRLGIKVGLLLVVFALVYEGVQPLPTLTNGITPALAKYERLPSVDYTNYMLVNHRIALPKADNEFRVVVLGDSGTYGRGLSDSETLTSQLNQMQLTTEDNRRIRFYNLAMPGPSFIGDYLRLEQSRQYAPDMVLWPATMHTFRLYFWPALVHVHSIDAINSALGQCTQQMPQLVNNMGDNPAYETFFDQRHHLQNLLISVIEDSGQRLIVPTPITSIDTRINNSPVHVIQTLSIQEEAYPVFADCLDHIDLPVLLVNEPIHSYSEDQSEEYYNSYYLRADYARHRELLAESAENADWAYADLYDAVPNAEFSNTAFHYAPDGIRHYIEALTPYILEVANSSVPDDE
jgi:hypothetical protein